MTSLGEASISLAQSALPSSKSTTTNVIVGAVILALSAFFVHYTSPMRLTAVLVAALHETEEAHLAAVEAGVLSGSDVHTEMLSSLQMKVSIIREASLCNSLSSSQALRELLKGHTLALLRCIWEVQGLQTHIEILKERQLRHLGLPGIGTPTRAVAFRRRYDRFNSFKRCKCS
ncbi:hypothetical protein B0H17DRAFT_1197997 [Mycena rosella]|uniref:Uncharacterized protein n=1 Tax=Mycena rosella TaxID=1033263 RepID=A0AAD7DRJ0_MYCRO|nr:hypothetical protein B0H17DRAFT_1197997 [Mycena rosella]